MRAVAVRRLAVLAPCACYGHVRVMTVSIENYFILSTLLFVIYLSIIVIIFFIRDDQKMELVSKERGF